MADRFPEKLEPTPTRLWHSLPEHHIAIPAVTGDVYHQHNRRRVPLLSGEPGKLGHI